MIRHYGKLFFDLLFPPVLLALGVVLVPRLLVFFLPFVIGWIIAALANPFIRFLNQKTQLMQRKHASAFIIVLLLMAIAGLLYLLISGLIRFGMQSVHRLPELYNWVQNGVLRFMQEYQALFAKLPQSVNELAASLYENIDSLIGSFVSSLASPAASVSVSAVKSLPTALVYMVVTIFSAYCFAIDREKIMEQLGRLVPPSVKHYMAFLKSDVIRIIQGWLLAQCKIWVVVFVVLAAGLLLMRVRYAIPIAFVTAVLDFLPLFGVGFVLWPWALFSAISGEYMQMLFLLLLYVLAQAARQLMQPKIMGDTMGMPPFWTILLLYLGFKFYGLTGMIFAVPVGMLFLSVYRYGAFDKMFAAAKTLYEEFKRLL